MSPDQPFNDQNPADPQSWNIFNYARNNPLYYADPTGMYVQGPPKPPGDPTNDFLLWAMLSFLTPVAQVGVQVQQIGNQVITAIDSFRGNPNCAAALTAMTTGAGTAYGASQLAPLGAAGGLVIGAPSGPGAFVSGAGGAALAAAFGGAVGGTAGYYGGNIAGAIFCKGNGGGGAGGTRRVTNPKHHSNSASPEPKNAEKLFEKSVADKSGVRWAKDADGTIHRFSRPSNGESHWNGSTGGTNPIRLEDIPSEIRRLLR